MFFERNGEIFGKLLSFGPGGFFGYPSESLVELENFDIQYNKEGYNIIYTQYYVRCIFADQVQYHVVVVFLALWFGWWF